MWSTTPPERTHSSPIPFDPPALFGPLVSFGYGGIVVFALVSAPSVYVPIAVLALFLILHLLRRLIAVCNPTRQDVDGVRFPSDRIHLKGHTRQVRSVLRKACVSPPNPELEFHSSLHRFEGAALQRLVALMIVPCVLLQQDARFFVSFASIGVIVFVLLRLLTHGYRFRLSPGTLIVETRDFLQYKVIQEIPLRNATIRCSLGDATLELRNGESSCQIDLIHLWRPNAFLAGLISASTSNLTESAQVEPSA